jgi:F-type H+-transporting ATPase subunit delta
MKPTGDEDTFVVEEGRVRHRTVLDVGGQRVAHVYAEALLNAAEEEHQADAVVEEFESLVDDVFRASPEMEAAFGNYAIGRHVKEEVIRKAFEGRASGVFLHFLLVLNQHERLELLRPILAAVKAVRDQRGGRVRALVTSAAPLPDDQRERLVQELREVTKREPVLEARVDPELIGGLVVRVGDWVYDASVRTEIEDIRKQIIERGSHEIQSGRNRFSVAAGD